MSADYSAHLITTPLGTHKNTVFTSQKGKTHFAFDLAIPRKLHVDSPSNATVEISVKPGFPLHSAIKKL